MLWIKKPKQFFGKLDLKCCTKGTGNADLERGRAPASLPPRFRFINHSKGFTGIFALQPHSEARDQG